jgi:hypothetical protein
VQTVRRQTKNGKFEPKPYLATERTGAAENLGFSCWASRCYCNACRRSDANEAVSSQHVGTEIRELRAKMLRATEENIETLLSLQFNRTLAAICLYDIDDIQTNIADQLSRIGLLLSSKNELGDENRALFIYIKTEVDVTTKGIQLKRKRAQSNAQLCGSVPIVVSRAQVLLSMLDQTERILSQLN